MIFLLLFVIAFAIFLKLSDSSFNLYFWNRVLRRSEDAHYRGKVVWIVGSSTGIGEEIALRLAQFAPSLILSSRREELLQGVARKCRDVNPVCQVKVLPMDTTDFAAMPDKVKAADQVFGKKVDIVILNAGRTQRAEWTEVEPSVDMDCFKVNTLGPTQLTRCLLKQRGLHPTGDKHDNLQFIVINSIAALLPAVLSPSYAASKAALMQYFRLLAVELGEKGVKVSIVFPSHVYAPNLQLTAFTAETGKDHGEILEAPRKAQMMPDRAAELISLAAVNEIHECVISATAGPMLFTYVYGLSPGVIARLINRVGALRFRKMRGGHE